MTAIAIKMSVLFDIYYQSVCGFDSPFLHLIYSGSNYCGMIYIKINIYIFFFFLQQLLSRRAMDQH